MTLRRSEQTLLVLIEFMQSAETWRYGYHISRCTGLKSGTLYPILMRLTDHKLLETKWETATEGRPPRHLYKLTDAGCAYASQQIKAERARNVGQPALAKVGAL